MSKNKSLYGHTSFETAYKIENYPWGYTLKTTQYVWVETLPKKGDRIVRQTLDPKSGKLCAEKKSTFNNIMWLYIDEVTGHVHSTGLGIYTKPEIITACIDAYGVENLNEHQKRQYNQLMGVRVVEVDEFSGKVKKDYSVKWEKETISAGWKDGTWNKGEKGTCVEVKITFDRPDGVAPREIYEAMKSLNQDKLKEVFVVRDYGNMGKSPGVVRICCRGGVYLGEMSEESYRNYLASDANTIAEDKV